MALANNLDALTVFNAISEAQNEQSALGQAAPEIPQDLNLLDISNVILGAQRQAALEAAPATKGQVVKQGHLHGRLTFDVLGMLGGVDRADSVSKILTELGNIPQSKQLRKLGESKTFFEAAKALVPAIPDIIAQQIGLLGTVGVPIVGATAGAGAVIGTGAGPGGTLAGAAGGVPIGLGATSAAAETVGALIERLGKSGQVDFTNPDSIRAAFANKELIREHLGPSATKGGIIGLIDFLSARIAGRFVSAGSRSLRDVIKQTAVETLGVQAPLGAFGELAGEVAGGEEIQPGAILAEFGGEVGLSIPTEIIPGVIRRGGLERAPGQPRKTRERELTTAEQTPEQEERLRANIEEARQGRFGQVVAEAPPTPGPDIPLALAIEQEPPQRHRVARRENAFLILEGREQSAQEIRRDEFLEGLRQSTAAGLEANSPIHARMFTVEFSSRLSTKEEGVNLGVHRLTRTEDIRTALADIRRLIRAEEKAQAGLTEEAAVQQGQDVLETIARLGRIEEGLQIALAIRKDKGAGDVVVPSNILKRLGLPPLEEISVQEELLPEEPPTFLTPEGQAIEEGGGPRARPETQEQAPGAVPAEQRQPTERGAEEQAQGGAALRRREGQEAPALRKAEEVAELERQIAAREQELKGESKDVILTDEVRNRLLRRRSELIKGTAEPAIPTTRTRPIPEIAVGDQVRVPAATPKGRQTAGEPIIGRVTQVRTPVTEAAPGIFVVKPQGKPAVTVTTSEIVRVEEPVTRAPSVRTRQREAAREVEDAATLERINAALADREIRHAPRSSLSSSLRRTLKDAEFLLRSLTGRPIRVVTFDQVSGESSSGFFTPTETDVVFINRVSETPTSIALVHESLHLINQFDPVGFEAVINAVIEEANASDPQVAKRIAAALKRRGKDVSRGLPEEELALEVLSRIMVTPEFWSRVEAASSRSIARRMAEFTGRLFRKIARLLRFQIDDFGQFKRIKGFLDLVSTLVASERIQSTAASYIASLRERRAPTPPAKLGDQVKDAYDFPLSETPTGKRIDAGRYPESTPIPGDPDIADIEDQANLIDEIGVGRTKNLKEQLFAIFRTIGGQAGRNLRVSGPLGARLYEQLFQIMSHTRSQSAYEMTDIGNFIDSTHELPDGTKGRISKQDIRENRMGRAVAEGKVDSLPFLEKVLVRRFILPAFGRLNAAYNHVRRNESGFIPLPERAQDLEADRYWPLRIKQDKLRKMIDGDFSTVKELVDANPDITTDELLEKVQVTFRRGFDGFYAPLDQFDRFTLPDSWQEGTTDLRIVQNHLITGWTRVHEIQHFGTNESRSQEDESGRFRRTPHSMETFLDQIRREGNKERPGLGDELSNLARKLYRQVTLRERPAENIWAYLEGNYAVMSKVGNLTNGILQGSQLAIGTAPVFGVRRTIRAAMKVLTDKDLREALRRTGAIQIEFWRQMADIRGTGKLTELSRRILTAQGTIAVDQLLRLINAQAALTYLYDGVRAMTDAPESGGAKAMRRTIKAMGFTDQRINLWLNQVAEARRKPGFNPQDDDAIADTIFGTGTDRRLGTSEFVIAANRFTQFESDPLSRPVWADNAVGQMMGRLKTFALKQAELMSTHIVPETFKGNPWPLLTLLGGGVFFGEIYTGIKNWMTGRERRDKDWKDIIQTADGKEALGRMFHSLIAAGSFGIIMDSVEQRGASGLGINTRRLLPPVITTMENLFNSIAKVAFPPDAAESWVENARDQFVGWTSREIVAVGRLARIPGLQTENNIKAQRTVRLNKAGQKMHDRIDFRPLVREWNADFPEHRITVGDVRRKAKTIREREELPFFPE